MAVNSIEGVVVIENEARATFSLRRKFAGANEPLAQVCMSLKESTADDGAGRLSPHLITADAAPATRIALPAPANPELGTRDPPEFRLVQYDRGC